VYFIRHLLVQGVRDSTCFWGWSRLNRAQFWVRFGAWKSCMGRVPWLLLGGSRFGSNVSLFCTWVSFVRSSFMSCSSCARVVSMCILCLAIMSM